MSRREEVEKLKNVIGGSFGDDEECHYYGNEALDELAALAISSIPDRYTPREEVTEGWWFAKHEGTKERQGIRVSGDGDVGFYVWVYGDRYCDELSNFTDFLPVPAWLVEGIGEHAK